ncbi:MAG TPA: tannase/feruloyl esterase family alpha/beta hydrolase [Candidatus Angelobacter sp.]|nr:tannase/feruloyl esterase family alpha/beta hydrolase [Candidatus Angelobacter sp.]
MNICGPVGKTVLPVCSIRSINGGALCGSVLAVALFVIMTAPAFAVPCESLSSLKLADTTITAAQSIAAGAFTPTPTGNPFKDVPAFCRVIAEIKPAKDSNIKIEVWMPISGWNGKYQGLGNGGFAGMIGYPGMAVAVSRGYATAGTDTGHAGSGTDASWALGHPEKVIDFGFRAIHEMTLKAKAIIQAFYGDSPKRSYFASCSNGGREALMEAQRFPEDYDGILAGAPANFWTHMLVSGIWDLQALQGDLKGYIPAAKIPAISSAVLAACDAQDGVKDGIVNDPRDCHFDPSAMLCKEGDSKDCLTAPQAEALKRIYAGPKNSKGQQIFTGSVVGGEDGAGGWPAWITGTGPGKSLQYAFSNGFFVNMVFEDPNWDFKTFNFDTGVKIADDKAAHALNATDPNLKAFKARGGKLIIYHGWSDAAISPLNSIHYYNTVVETMGSQDANQFLRLFMAPGMQHCGGGPGPNSFGQSGNPKAPTDPQHNIYSALEQWVEKGVAPDRIVATKWVSDLDPAQGAKMTRPLCPHPQVAKYKGTGDTNDEANFTCVPGKK